MFQLILDFGASTDLHYNGPTVWSHFMYTYVLVSANPTFYFMGGLVAL